MAVNSVNISKRWRDRYVKCSVYLASLFNPSTGIVKFLFGYTAVELCIFNRTYKLSCYCVSKRVLVQNICGKFVFVNQQAIGLNCIINKAVFGSIRFVHLYMIGC